MAIVKTRARRGKLSKPQAPGVDSSLGSVGHYIGALPATEEAGEEAKVAEPKVPEPSLAPLEAASVKDGAPAERIGCYVGALPAMEETADERERAENGKGIHSSYGWVELQGKRYEFDVVVHVDGSVTKREKGISKKKREKYGHTPLTRKELGKEAPTMIIIGTGHSGSMPLTPKAERFLEDYLYFVGKTPMALQKLAECEEKAVALLHVTC